MAFVSVTRLHLASRRSFPVFLYHVLTSSRQASRAAGFLGGWLGNDPESGYWTVTVWASADAMRAYRNSGAHLRAMPKLLGWCDEASFTHFEQAGETIPDPALAYEQLRHHGKHSKTAAPSSRQQGGATVGHALPRRGQILQPRAS